MNVLLAEANVPYEELVDLDEINPQFPQANVALVVGANDVTNPAAPAVPNFGLRHADSRRRQVPERRGHEARPRYGLRRHPERASTEEQHPDAVR